MTENSLFILGTAGLTLMGLFFWLDRRNLRTASRHHTYAKLRGQIVNGYARAEMMVQHRDLTPEQVRTVDDYITALEKAHHSLGLGHTCRFARLRQTLTRNSHGLRVIV